MSAELLVCHLGRVEYRAAAALQETLRARVQSGELEDLLLLLEHPPVYSRGRRSDPSEIPMGEDWYRAQGVDVVQTDRGGKLTYHGPGQRTAYVMVDLGRRGRDVRVYVHALEEWLIRALDRFNVRGERREGRVGIWVADRARGTEDKVAAIGVRVTRWVTWHGVALTVDPDLGHFGGIVPCGVSRHGVTSLHRLGVPATMEEADAALRAAWGEVFG